MDPFVAALLLLMAVCGGLGDVLRKMMLAHMSAYQGILCMYGLFAIPCALAVLAVTGVPEVSPEAYLPWAVFLSVISLLLFGLYRGIQLCEVSLVMPLLGLAPVATLAGELIVFDKTTTVLGLLGVFLAAAGTYVLRLDTVKTGGVFAPFLKLFAEPGLRWGMLAVVLFAVAVPPQRMVLLTFGEGKRALAGGVALLVLTEGLTHLCVFTLLQWRSGKGLWPRQARWPTVFGAGFFWVTHMFILYWGFLATSPSYAMSFRSLSLFVATGVAAWKLNESVGKRLPGMFVIVAGVVLISLWG